MKMEDIQKAHQARPFKPFALHKAGGRILKVPHNEFLAYHPDGDTLIVYQNDQSYSVLDLNHVTELELLPANGTSKAHGKKGRR